MKPYHSGILFQEHHSMKISKTCAYVKKVLNNGNSVHHIAKVVRKIFVQYIVFVTLSNVFL